MESVNISFGVQVIEAYAFQGCTNLTHIIIPNSVNTMGNFVFDRCHDEFKIYCKATKAPKGWSSRWNVGKHIVIAGNESMEGYKVIWGYNGN